MTVSRAACPLMESMAHGHRLYFCEAWVGGPFLREAGYRGAILDTMRLKQRLTTPGDRRTINPDRVFMWSNRVVADSLDADALWHLATPRPAT